MICNVTALKIECYRELTLSLRHIDTIYHLYMFCHIFHSFRGVNVIYILHFCLFNKMLKLVTSEKVIERQDFLVCTSFFLCVIFI